MNPLVKKEIRLLLPSFLLGLLLAFSVWLIPAKSITDVRLGLNAFPFLCCPVVLVMMMLDSFGCELSAGTFSLLLSQPVPRARIWRIKTRLLAAAALILWLVWCVSYYLHNPGNMQPMELRGMFTAVALFVLAAFSGALWTTLLFRQVAAAFWFTILVPAILFVILGNLLEKYPYNVQTNIFTGVFTVYGIAGFLSARWLFLRAQDVVWTGGVINFSRWRYFESGTQSSDSTRRHRPVAALLKKEFQLHSISLFFACALLGLHIAVFFLRVFYSNYHKNSVAGAVSDFFWTLWLVVPPVIGCSAVAEERKLGMMDGQLCMPVSRRLQFALKFILALIFGILLGGVMPSLLEAIAAHFGAPNEIFTAKSHDGGPFGYGNALFWFQISIVTLAAGLAWVGFFTSTLTRNFLQALGVAIVTFLGCAMMILAFINGRMLFFDALPAHSILPLIIAVPTITIALLWLAYLNFKNFRDGWPLWQRNLLGVAGAIIFITVSSSVIYNRAWEFFEPAEPAHGPAKFSLANPPVIHIEGFGGFDYLLVRLPDGRVWFDRIGFRRSQHYLRNIIRATADPFPSSIGPQRFVTGSNWISAVVRHIENWPDPGTHITGYLETVGIQSDGTLWVSDKSDSPLWTEDKLTQFGNETNWQALSWSWQELSVLLLKKDGTLWRWGTNQWDWHESPVNWPALRNFNPCRIGTNSDWKDISFNNNYMQKADGSVWSIGKDPKSEKESMSPKKYFDQVDLRKMSQRWGCGEDGAYIRKDGTLWFLGNVQRRASNSKYFYREYGTFQIGKETNWVSATRGWRMLVVLKSDGTLWQLRCDFETLLLVGDVPAAQPTRLGIHNDWVAIAEVDSGVVSLAADGSLWFWPERQNYAYPPPLLKPPKQPQFLGNVFGKAD